MRLPDDLDILRKKATKKRAKVNTPKKLSAAMYRAQPVGSYTQPPYPTALKDNAEKWKEWVATQWGPLTASGIMPRNLPTGLDTIPAPKLFGAGFVSGYRLDGNSPAGMRDSSSL